MKFGDVIVVVASLVVVGILLLSLLYPVLVPINPDWCPVAEIVSILVSALIVGYVFAGRIREESRMISIGKVVVLYAAVMAFAIMIIYGVLGHYSAMVDETLRDMYSTGSWTNMDWVSYEAMLLWEFVALYVVLALVFSFIGLYLGSMLRKPKKS